MKCQQFFFKLTTNQNFDIVIMIVILLNMTTMAMEHHDEPQQLTVVLNFINQLFIAVFALECVMKLDECHKVHVNGSMTGLFRPCFT